MPKPTQVVAGIIVNPEGLILCVQRGPSSRAYISEKWEFPGGKVEDAESAREALIREIKEELSVDIVVSEYLMTVEHSYPDFHLSMQVFKCSILQGEVSLTEHVAMKWLTVEELPTLDWAAADVPVVERLTMDLG